MLSATSLNVTENTSKTYTVKLATEPTAATVTVKITGHSGAYLTLDKTSLTFTDTNWSIPQTVKVEADEDDNTVHDEATLLHTASGGDYAGLTASLMVTIEDDDFNEVEISAGRLFVTEGGTASYTIKLTTEPSDDVTVKITGHAGTDLTLDKTTLTFTKINWSMPQAVKIEARDDDDASDDSVILTNSASGGGYHKGSGMLIIVKDDDEPEIVLSTQSLGVTEGGEDTYTVKLATEPTDTVTVKITGHSGTDLMLDKTSLTFNPSGSNLWSTAQTVKVQADEDDDAFNDAATLIHTASGGDYASETASLTVNTTDNETAGIVLSTQSLRISEGGGAQYSVKLATEPTDTVTVEITGHSDTDLTLDKTTLTFTKITWSTPQTVKVEADEDDDANDDRVALNHTASGGGYALVTGNIVVTVTDSNTASLVCTPVALQIEEGSAGSYTVELATRPSATVTVMVTGTEGTDLTVDTDSDRDGNQDTLTFTPNNWNDRQTVTVTADDDDDRYDDIVALRLTASGGDYDSVTDDLMVTVTDKKIVIEPIWYSNSSDNDDLTIEWKTTTFRDYTVEFCTHLVDWTALAGPLTGDGSTLFHTVNYDVLENERIFLRVVSVENN